jgi:hypothetical protein
MIYISETYRDEKTVQIKVEGRLDRTSLPSLMDVCHHHLSAGKGVRLQLDGVIHITHEGKDFLRELRSRAELVGLPEYLMMEIDDQSMDD